MVRDTVPPTLGAGECGLSCGRLPYLGKQVDSFLQVVPVFLLDLSSRITDTQGYCIEDHVDDGDLLTCRMIFSDDCYVTWVGKRLTLIVQPSQKIV